MKCICSKNALKLKLITPEILWLNKTDQPVQKIGKFRGF